MKASLDFRDGFLCVLHSEGAEPVWFPISKAAPLEVQTLIGRSLTQIDPEQGTYLDEEGNVYQLAAKGETKPVAVGRIAACPHADLTPLGEKPKRGRGSRRRIGQNHGAKSSEHASKSESEGLRLLDNMTVNGSEAVVQGKEAVDDAGHPSGSRPLNLGKKLALVRRRLGYIQKRGHNERHHYNYVTAADLAGSVGDILAELGVVMIPELQSITTETPRSSSDRIARVVMNYRFLDTATGEELTVRVAGEGADAGDKAPYKAMTGALKYALLQSFLIATGDDPENESGRPHSSQARTITEQEAKAIYELVEKTGTELERVLEYYKVSSVEEMTEATHRRAMETLGRKLARMDQQQATSDAQG